MTLNAPSGALMDAMSAQLAQNWWAVAVRGVAAVLFGVLALIVPGATMLSLVILFGAYMLVDAIFAVASAVRAAHRHERWPLLVLQGVADIAAAAVAFLWPGITVIAFVLLFAVWSIVSGAFALTTAFRLRMDHGRFWLGLSGVLNIVFGILLVLAPLIGAVVLTWWIGAFALLLGVNLLVLAFRLRSHRADRLPSGVAAGV